MSKGREQRTSEGFEAILRQQEACEQEMIAHALWLGGFFEAGGSLSFMMSRDPKSRRKNVRPHIAFSDNDERRVQRLQNLFGGGITKHSIYNSWQWHLSGSKAIILANSVEPYAPSHEEFLTLAHMWDDLTPEERVIAVEEIKSNSSGNKRRKVTDTALYARLVQQPAFVAGVIDCRGGMYRIQQKNAELFPEIDVYTPNVYLLEALQQHYGGSVSYQATTRRSDNWAVKGRQAYSVYSIIQPHLILRTEMAEQIFGQLPPRGLRRR